MPAKERTGVSDRDAARLADVPTPRALSIMARRARRVPHRDTPENLLMVAGLRGIERSMRDVDDALHGGDHVAALELLMVMTREMISLMTPYINGMAMTYPHTLIVLTNGSTLRTTSNVPADIAGLINAGLDKIYVCTDHEGVVHNLVVTSILDFYEVTAP